MIKPFYRASELAKACGISQSTVLKRIREGKLNATQVLNRYQISFADCIKFICDLNSRVWFDMSQEKQEAWAKEMLEDLFWMVDDGKRK